MADKNFNSSMQLPDANCEVEIEALIDPDAKCEEEINPCVVDELPDANCKVEIEVIGPDANCEEEIEAIDPCDDDNLVLSERVATALESMGKKMEKVSPPETQPYIYKVYKKLRDVNEKAYEPVMLAIGPYHRGKDNLKMMEEHKWRYLKALLDRRPDIRFENYISAMAEMEQKVRNCYAESVDHISSAEFIEMLVLDGCFIVELMQRYTAGYSAYRVNDIIFQSSWFLNNLWTEMMLFENQIPFFVLCKLFDLIDAPNQHNRLIRLVLLFFRSCFPGVARLKAPNSTSNDGKGRKLFDNLVFKKIWPPGAGTSSSSQDAKHEHNLLQSNRSSQDIMHILDLLHSNWSCSSSNGDANTQVKGGMEFIQSAADLKDGNVKFRVSSEYNTLFDVDFNKGTLSMPPLIISNDTESTLRNLIAYEQFFPDNRPTSFTDYAWLLDCLINSSSDVKLLSECGIICNWVGDNEVIVKIFNEITDHLILGTNFAHAKTFHLINTHYHKKKNRAIANLKRNYFNSPWAYISFFAALLLLSLTIAQTLLSALQLG